MTATQTVDHGTGDAGAVIATYVRDVPDFPVPGVMFKDLMPLFGSGPAFRTVIDAIGAHYATDGDRGFDIVCGIDARGFVLAGAISYATGAGQALVRKAGKLPRATHQVAYALEYGEATLEVHIDAFDGAPRVLVVDDVLATGGTVAATAELVERAGARLVGVSVLLELAFLGGRARLAGLPVHALLTV